MSGNELSYLVAELEEGRLSRRGFLRQAVLLGLSIPAAGSILSACGGDGSASKKEQEGTLNIVYWAWIGDVAGWLPELKQRFEEDHPGVTVRLSPLAVDETTPATLVQKYGLEARQGKASADLLMGTAPFSIVDPLVKAKAVRPIDEILPSSFTDRVAESVLRENTSPDGKIYSFPFWQDVFGFIYRKDLLAKHLGSDTPPATWEEVVQFSERLAAKLPKGSYAYGADWSFFHRLFLPIFVTKAAEPFASNGTANMADPAAVETLELIKTLHGFMPPGSGEQLGSAKVFQAQKMAMESYWQAQYFRAKEAGVDPATLGVAGNPRGTTENTIFWSTSAVVLAKSKKAELAVKFLAKYFLDDAGVKRSISEAGRILPFTDIEDSYPAWMRPLYRQLLEGTGLPANSAFEKVEQPAWKKEAGRMILEGQSVQETARKLQDAFSKYTP